MPVLKNIYRYPIKGLSAQPLTRVALQAKQPFPHDRVYALVRPGGVVISDPSVDELAGLIEIDEQALIEKLVAHPAVEGLDSM